MKSKVITHNTALKFLSILLVISIMVGTAQYYNEFEIIFPEILALLIGGILAPQQAWNVSKMKLIVLMGLSSIIGILITNFLVVPLYLQLLLGLLFAYIALLLSKTTIVPIISACILPIMIGTKSRIYPVSVIVLCCIVVLLQISFNIENKKEGEHFTAKKLSILFICLSIIVALPVYFGHLYLVIPPLIVAFTEFTNPKCEVTKRPIELIVILALAAGIGMIARCVGIVQYNLPVILVAFLVTLFLIAIIFAFKLYFPPVGAIALLPLILPYSDVLWLYAIEVTISSLVLYLISKKLRFA